MSEWIKLHAADGTEIDAYVARPTGSAKGALVVVQEIFGVNRHMQSVVDGYAHEGYLVIAPQMFDRQQKHVDLDYSKEGWAEAMRLAKGISFDLATQDVDAAVQWLRQNSQGKVGVVGFCFGGTMAWLASIRLKVDAAVGYYGGSISQFVDGEPKAPVMLHFGAKDEHIPHEVVEKIRSAHPDVPVYVYEDAGHAFNRDADPTAYVASAAEIALSRTLAFLEKHLGAA